MTLMAGELLNFSICSWFQRSQANTITCRSFGAEKELHDGSTARSYRVASLDLVVAALPRAMAKATDLFP